MLARRLALSAVQRPIAPSSTQLLLLRTPTLRLHARLLSAEEDPDMTGGYAMPPRTKRQFRDPYGDWWDKQERKNFNEPLHEDNDVLGMFSLEEYTHFSPAKGALLMAAFVATFLSVIGVVYIYYPDSPAYPLEFEDGLEAEMGGPKTIRARKAGDPL